MSTSFQTEKLNMHKITLKKRRIKILLIFFFLLFGLILFFSIFSEDAAKLYQKYFVNNHQEVENYLEKINLYKNDSNEIVDSIRVKFNEPDAEKFTIEVNQAKGELQHLIKKTVALAPPEGFHQYKDYFIEVLNQQMLVLSVYNKTRKTYDFQELNKSTNILSLMQNQERKVLLQSFKNIGINYKVLGDGSIRYWYKGHSANSLNRIQ